MTVPPSSSWKLVWADEFNAWGTDRRWVAKGDSIRKPLGSFGDPEWSKKFHVWRMDWDENTIRLYVDDLLLNLAVGGQNGGDPSPTKFPSRFDVDYVRVYQQQK